jgi:cytochrome c oxidase subunit I+III
LWDRPALRGEVDAGAHYLPGIATGQRETIVTSAIDAQPQYVLRLPGPSWLPVGAGVGTAVFFLALTVKWLVVAAFGALVAFVCIIKWLWQSDPPSSGRLHDIGGGIRLPDYMSGSQSHSWWSMVVLMLVDASIFACAAFAFFYLWTVSPGFPPPGLELPLAGWSVVSAVAWIASAGAMIVANGQLARPNGIAFSAASLGALVLSWAGLLANLQALTGAGLSPSAHGFTATVYMLATWSGVHVALLTCMVLYTLARGWAGKLDAERRNTFDNTKLMVYCSAAQAVVGLCVMHAPRFAS